MQKFFLSIIVSVAFVGMIQASSQQSPRRLSNISLELMKIKDAKAKEALQNNSPVSVSGAVCQSPTMRDGLFKSIDACCFTEAKDLLSGIIAEKGYSVQLGQQVGESLIAAKDMIVFRPYSPVVKSDIDEIGSMAKCINEFSRMQTPRFQRAKLSCAAKIKDPKFSREDVLNACENMINIKSGKDR